MLDEMTQQNASKFAIFLEYENIFSFFHFSFRATLFFPLMNALHCPLNPFKTQKWVFEIGLLYTNYFARKFSKCVLVNIYMDFCQLTAKKLKKLRFSDQGLMKIVQKPKFFKEKIQYLLWEQDAHWSLEAPYRVT